MDLLSKLAKVEIKNDTRVSKKDRLFCEQEEEKYKEALELNKKVIELMEPIADKYKQYESDYSFTKYITLRDIRKIENEIDTLRYMFASSVVDYFKKAYNVSLESKDIPDLYGEKIIYNNILDEIFKQLGGFSFTQKAEDELVKNAQNTIYRDDKVQIRKNKLSITNYIYWRDGWNGSKELSWNDSTATPFLVALSHYDAQIYEMTNYFRNVYTMLRDGDEKHDIFSKLELGYNKVKTMKFFKNGKVEIEFQSYEQAVQFFEKYLKS
ncbi:hypothetical protein ACI2JA_03870 [Alkalihalobacillus sp. NPDC078783]